MQAKSPKSPSVTFDTTLTAFGNNTGIVVAPELIDELGSGQRPALVVEVNGYQYCNSVGVMGGKYLISVSAGVRAATGLRAGDAVHVVLTVADGPREVVVPPDFEESLGRDEAVRSFFLALSNSLQRYHVDLINGAKTPETRQRRIAKALDLFKAGKPR